ncbi:MAG: hypothetical protein J3K34DRAFT_422293 [Monoraphidium minutum]|nr:MAG: hypothetical protein J3K34DRAFT_422293 [Monoraphidium minutum]
MVSVQPPKACAARLWRPEAPSCLLKTPEWLVWLPQPNNNKYTQKEALRAAAARSNRRAHLVEPPPFLAAHPRSLTAQNAPLARPPAPAPRKPHGTARRGGARPPLGGAPAAGLPAPCEFCRRSAWAAHSAPKARAAPARRSIPHHPSLTPIRCYPQSHQTSNRAPPTARHEDRPGRGGLAPRPLPHGVTPLVAAQQ